MVEAPPRSDGSLYRILSFERVVEIFETRELHFAHPSSWGDPFEKRLQHRASDRLFAQCWCKKGVSDAMWRIYSPGKIGVRIRTTRNRLSDQLKNACLPSGMRLKVKDVRYLKETDLNHELEGIADSLAQNFKTSVAANALFLKRLAFRHEAEVRAVVYDERGGDNRKGIKIGVDPHELIQSLLIDPRAPDAYVKAFGHYVLEKLEFRGTVLKSALYSQRTPLEVG